MTGLELRSLRLSRGLTQAELARELGVSRPHVSLMEGSDQVPERHLSTLRRIAHRRRVPVLAESLRRSRAASGPQRRARTGSSAIAPGVCIMRSTTPRWEGWEVRASVMQRDRQRLRSWTLGRWSLDDALREAAAYRAHWTGDDPNALHEHLRAAVPKRLRREVRAWRSKRVG